ncbi:MAG TPA: bifunctional alpha,alpha-trehalose-phosphate synthase (UDP-forming)/trehalose-phosphatase [Dehalococcoidia bacterium]|nr:bifunctional alpha,alpha-trehalose-phosphate synthase (UDP-forming)/trehalose-phosphatase [Dehalococcoidia bacterium]
MNRLVIVSNRLPVTAHVQDGELVVEPSNGGLATGLIGPHERCDGLWIGWPGDLPQLSGQQQQALTARLDELRAVAVPLSHREVKAFYEDVANGILWPIFHDLVHQVPSDLRGWDTFRAANARFARAAAARREPGDLIWVHDYQLVLVPGMLRELAPDARVGFFLHIPFPPEGLLGVLPWREEVLRGMLGADLVGFHTYGYLRHFCEALRRVLGLDAELDGVTYAGRRVRFGVFPMGVDAQAWSARGDDPAVRDEAAAIRADGGGTKLLVGIDRLDYTKGLPRRLLAVDRVLKSAPELRGDLRLIQVTVPSREKVEAYAGLRRRIDEMVGRINSRYATPTSAPIHRMHTSLSPERIAALYRAADVMLVTPLRDGMNLVAKEFVATRTDEDGVLVLSKSAGAAAELGQALLVNPYDIDEVAAAVRTALAMPREERRERMRAMRRRVASHDVHRWAETFMDELRRDPPAAPAVVTREPSDDLTRFVARVRERREMALILDYDGTLMPFAPTPDAAPPDAELIELLRRLADRPGIRVHVVSGRPRETLAEWLGALPIGLHAEHGFASRMRPEAAWIEHGGPATDWKRRVQPILKHFAGTTPGAFVEEKRVSLAWHYRAAAADTRDRDFVASQARELRLVLEETLASLPVEILPGNMVLEVRARGVSKANVVPLILAQGDGREAVLAMGDDRTDEDLFAAVPEGSLTVHVGEGDTRALYRVPDVASARQLLATLID